MSTAVMTEWMRGSPLLFVPVIAPLVLMIFWVLRVWLTRWYATPGGSIPSSA